MNIPSQYLPVMPYLILRQAPEFLEFSKKVFGATEQMIVQGQDGRGIMHGEIKIHDAVIMFAGSNDNWGEKPSGMFLYVEDTDQVYKTAIANGSKSLHEPTQMDYGYSAGFEDPFGNQWWIVRGN